jgi:hypothetical protein
MFIHLFCYLCYLIKLKKIVSFAGALFQKWISLKCRKLLRSNAHQIQTACWKSMKLCVWSSKELNFIIAEESFLSEQRKWVGPRSFRSLHVNTGFVIVFHFLDDAQFRGTFWD